MILRLMFVDSVSLTIYPPFISAFWALGFGFAASTMSATFINGVLGPQTRPVILRQRILMSEFASVLSLRILVTVSLWLQHSLASLRREGNARLERFILSAVSS